MPYSFRKLPGIIYIPSHTDTVAHSKALIYPVIGERFGLVYWGLTPQQQPGSYQGGEMVMKSVFCWRKPEYPEETTDLRQVIGGRRNVKGRFGPRDLAPQQQDRVEKDSI